MTYIYKLLYSVVSMYLTAPVGILREDNTVNSVRLNSGIFLNRSPGVLSNAES